MRIFSKLKPKTRAKLFVFAKSFFWFSIGASLGLFLLVSFIFIFFKQNYKNVVYPGIKVNNIEFGGKSKDAVKLYFDKQNESFADSKFVFVSDQYETIGITARELEYGYDSQLLADQAYSIGRSTNAFSNLSLVFQAYLNAINLSPAYRFSEEKLSILFEPVRKKINIEPVNALFQFENGRVTTFQPSSSGQMIDMPTLIQQIYIQKNAILEKKQSGVTLQIPIKILKPSISTNQANELGIEELIGTGTSLFQGSIPNRIHNIITAARKINGILIPPNEEFSFDKALGDISVFTGFKQAYVIQDGKTVLGDGGGVCQVSTTFFRAILAAGLPITERNAHAYRVHYYEEDSPPGIDATIFFPSVDLKFRNTTGHNILVQTVVDENNLRLTIYLYGAKDGREVTLSKPVITSQTPAPPALYQDDPTLPKGVMKQVDFSADGASVFFTRVVKQNGKVIISEKFTSNYRPWQAIFLRGTQ